jgi:hypothetical protein
MGKVDEGLTYVPTLLLEREKSSKMMELPGAGRFWKTLFCSSLRPARVVNAIMGSKLPKSWVEFLVSGSSCG